MYYTLQTATELIYKAKKALSTLALIIIREKKKKGYSDYDSYYIEYNILLNSIIKRVNYDLEDDNFQKLIHSIYGIINKVTSNNLIISSSYSIIEDEMSSSIISLNSFFGLPDTFSKDVLNANKVLKVSSDGQTIIAVKEIIGTNSGSFKLWNYQDALNGNYDIDSVVSYNAKIWRSLIVNNTIEPSLTATSQWEAQSVETLANAVLLRSVVSNIASGATGVGTSFPIGMSFTEYVEKKEITTYYPILNAPSFSLNSNQPSLLKIGSIVNVGLTLNFNRGSIFLQGGYQNAMAGAANSYTLNGTIQGTNARTISAYLVVRGVNVFTGDVSYNVGSQPKDSNNANFSVPLLAGTSPTQSTSFEGVYPLYVSSVNITIASEQELISMINSNLIQLSLVGETGGNKQFFDIPDAWGRPLSYINYFNTISGQWDGANRINDFAVTSVTNAGISYKRRTYTGIDRGSILIRLGF